MVNILIFLLAFFLDFFELSFIVVPLLAPVAEKLGIDLVWFGVLLAVNMQTSFMHPPFGFALFYLRSVAPDKAYIDRVTRKEILPVTTGQIYWGAVPFVIIQIIMVGLIIAFPGIVSQDKVEKIDLDKVKIEMPADMPGSGGSTDPLAPPPALQPGSDGVQQGRGGRAEEDRRPVQEVAAAGTPGCASRNPAYERARRLRRSGCANAHPDTPASHRRDAPTPPHIADIAPKSGIAPLAKPAAVQRPERDLPAGIRRRTAPWLCSYTSGCARRKACCSASGRAAMPLT